jgi:hypothetical protein
LCRVTNQITLELGERPKDVEDQFPGAGGINILGQTAEATATLVQRRNGFDQALSERPYRSRRQTTTVSPSLG